ncbi:MAG: hypothetical protein HKM05_08105 [Spirochaetales bacterium]|nr:hypothetical protein [Spirochaetales bacterium]
MADKSGNWFLELILNILILGAVAFITLQARAEQERGVSTPLLAAVSGGAQSINRALGNNSPSIPALPAVPALPGAPSLNNADSAVSTLNFTKAWGALQIWAAGLDGKVTQGELNGILANMKSGWTDTTQSAQDYLKQINNRINHGQTDAVIREALGTIAKVGADKKAEVLGTISKLMAQNGVSWGQIQAMMSNWTRALTDQAQKLISH